MTDIEGESQGNDGDFRYLTVDQVTSLHEKLITSFSPTESMNILNQSLLESAVMTPQQSFEGQKFYSSLPNIAAAYIEGLALNHAFENGNKRVALAAGSVFLRMNGYKLTLSQDEAEKLIYDLIGHKIDRYEAAEIIGSAIQPL